MPNISKCDFKLLKIKHQSQQKKYYYISHNLKLIYLILYFNADFDVLHLIVLKLSWYYQRCFQGL